MKAVILAAGEGKRMLPLTANKPKPLLEVRGKAIIEHIFDALPKEIDEVIVAVKYLGEQIKYFLENKYPERKKIFIEGSSLGSAYSLMAAKSIFAPGERFVVIHGDDLPSRKEISDCLKHDSGILVCESCEPENCGVIKLNGDGTLAGICEKNSNPETNKVLGGVMVLRSEIFDCVAQPSDKGEFFVSSLINEYVQKFPVHPVYTGACRQFSCPSDLVEVEKILKQRL